MPHPLLQPPDPQPRPGKITPTSPPADGSWEFNFDPKGIGFTREEFMAQADECIDKYIDVIQRSPITTPALAGALLAVRTNNPHVVNWQELIAVWLATALQRLAFLSEQPEHRIT